MPYSLRDLEILSMGKENFDRIYPGNTYVPRGVESLIGQRFGKLIVVKYAGECEDGQPSWCCRCDCGNVVRVRGGNLLGARRGAEFTKSCGCIRWSKTTVSACSKSHKLYWEGLPADVKAERIRKRKESLARSEKRRFCYSMDAHRAAEVLGVSYERIDVLAHEGIIGSVVRRGELWVSSKDVSSLLARQSQQKKRCRVADQMMGLS